jgi:hypothetical protein
MTTRENPKAQTPNHRKPSITKAEIAPKLEIVILKFFGV